MKTAEVVEAFIASRRARGCSTSYESWLRYTLGHLARAYEELPTTPEAVELVLAGLNGVSDETRFDVWSAVRRFYRWAAARLGVADAAAVVEQPLRRPKLLRTLADGELDRLLGSRLSRRDRAVVLLLVDTGMRIGEPASITWPDVGPSTVRVSGKTGGREIPMSSTTARALLGRGDGGRLWVGERGPMEVHGLQQVVRRALARAGFRGGPHLLRHTFGRLYIMAGGDVFSLQRIMGHRQVSTTWRYVGMDLRDVQVQHERFSPIARRAAR
jgi:integrase/recombinase XerD